MAQYPSFSPGRFQPSVDLDFDVARERRRIRCSRSSSSSASSSLDVLHLVELSKSWSRGTSYSLPAVDRLSLGVGAGEIVGLLGANGAGKSTALNIVAGEIISTSGEVEWFFDKVVEEL